MTILVTGATGAIGGRLVEQLVADGHAPRVASRSPHKLIARWPTLDAVELDVLRPATLRAALDGVQAAYYLVHSMEPGTDGDFRARDAEGANAFADAARAAGLERVIYLGGLGDEGASSRSTSRAATRPGGYSPRPGLRCSNSVLRWS